MSPIRFSPGCRDCGSRKAGPSVVRRARSCGCTSRTVSRHSRALRSTSVSRGESSRTAVSRGGDAQSLRALLPALVTVVHVGVGGGATPWAAREAQMDPVPEPPVEVLREGEAPKLRGGEVAEHGAGPEPLLGEAADLDEGCRMVGERVRPGEDRRELLGGDPTGVHPHRQQLRTQEDPPMRDGSGGAQAHAPTLRAATTRELREGGAVDDPPSPSSRCRILRVTDGESRVGCGGAPGMVAKRAMGQPRPEPTSSTAGRRRPKAGSGHLAGWCGGAPGMVAKRATGRRPMPLHPFPLVTRSCRPSSRRPAHRTPDAAHRPPPSALHPPPSALRWALSSHHPASRSALHGPFIPEPALRSGSPAPRLAPCAHTRILHLSPLAPRPEKDGPFRDHPWSISTTPGTSRSRARERPAIHVRGRPRTGSVTPPTRRRGRRLPGPGAWGT